MGDASPPKGEYILVCLPFTETILHPIIEGIKKRHHNVEIEYHDINFIPGWTMGNNNVSDGILIYLIPFPELSNKVTQNHGKRSPSS